MPLRPSPGAKGKETRGATAGIYFPCSGHGDFYVSLGITKHAGLPYRSPRQREQRGALPSQT